MARFKDCLPATLLTERLILATPALEHVPQMAQLADNKRIHAVLSRLPHPYKEEHGRQFVTEIARGPTEHAWSILLGDRYIGTIGLHILPKHLPAVGYWLGEPYWGRGFATEACRAVVAAARAAGAQALHARVLLTNTGSRNVLRKTGFREVTDTDETHEPSTDEGTALLRLDFQR